MVPSQVGKYYSLSQPQHRPSQEIWIVQAALNQHRPLFREFAVVFNATGSQGLSLCTCVGVSVGKCPEEIIMVEDVSFAFLKYWIHMAKLSFPGGAVIRSLLANAGD